jgi:hypothetical protein
MSIYLYYTYIQIHINLNLAIRLYHFLRLSSIEISDNLSLTTMLPRELQYIYIYICTCIVYPLGHGHVETITFPKVSNICCKLHLLGIFCDLHFYNFSRSRRLVFNFDAVSMLVQCPGQFSFQFELQYPSKRKPTYIQSFTEHQKSASLFLITHWIPTNLKELSSNPPPNWIVLWLTMPRFLFPDDWNICFPFYEINDSRMPTRFTTSVLPQTKMEVVATLHVS